MKKRYKDKWIKALRGQSPQGEYKQGFGRLVSFDTDGNDCFCALGVLVNEVTGFVPEPNWVWPEMSPPTELVACPVGSGLDHSWFDCSTSDWFSAKVGLDEDLENMIVSANDNRRESFAEIADWIEKNI